MAPPGAFGHLSLALGAAVAALGSILFIAWRTYFPGGGRWGARWEPPLAAGQVKPGLGGLWDPGLGRARPDFSMRQVLVLGLKGAGKSSVLHYISSEAAKDRTAPTQGFNSVQVYADGFQIDLLELGGSQNLRFYWNQYLSQAHVLVFVVDSADRPHLPTARQELHWLLAEDPRLPLVVLANKQVRISHGRRVLAGSQERAHLPSPVSRCLQARCCNHSLFVAEATGRLVSLPYAQEMGVEGERCFLELVRCFPKLSSCSASCYPHSFPSPCVKRQGRAGAEEPQGPPALVQCYFNAFRALAATTPRAGIAEGHRQETLGRC
uniref:Uncharacterized protein n=1 Tax=Gopherus agassizii TaxID=38772 RepID=A0A452HS12_9SAUR